MPHKDPAKRQEWWELYKATDKYKAKIERDRAKRLALRQTEVGRAIYYDNNLRDRYGITILDYNRMFAEQEGKCAICGAHQSELNRRLHVDHCHTTGAVRGLLCQHCNHAIGKMKDDPALLRAAAEYLETPRDPPKKLEKAEYGSRAEGGNLYLFLLRQPGGSHYEEKQK